MATVERQLGRTERGVHPRSGGPSHRGQDALAEVVVIRPERAPRRRWLGSLVTTARDIMSPRAQATSARPSPRPPSSPAPRSAVSPPPPRDAA